MIKLKKFKLILLGGFLFFFPISFFKKYESKWFNNIPQDESAHILRQRFWKSAIWSSIFVGTVVFTQLSFFRFCPNTKYWLQVMGSTIALIATFCRGGWSIQSWSGETPLEDIARGTFIISYLGATCILLFTLIF